METIKNNNTDAQYWHTTPQLRFPEFTGSWEKKKLGDVTTKINSGKTPLGGQAVYSNHGVIFIRSQNITDDRLDLTNVVYIPNEINETMKNSIVESNDILLNITGASLGRSCVVPINFSIGNVNQHVCIIRLKNKFNPYFLQPIFSSFKGQKIFSQLQTGSGREGLNFESIRKIVIQFPSLPEQTKIASFLTTVDDKLQVLKKKKEALERYKKGMMQKLFSQEIRFKDDNGNEFPVWEMKKLGEVLKERNLKSPKTSEYPLMSFVAYKGVTHKGERYNREFLVNDEDKKLYKRTEFGDFIYSSNNLETGSIGLNLFGSSTISPVYSIFQINQNQNFEFLGKYLVRNPFIYKMTRFRQGVVYGQWRIHESDFLNIIDYFPSLAEQTKIANFLSALDDKINQVEKQVQGMEQWKKGLLQKMFV